MVLDSRSLRFSYPLCYSPAMWPWMSCFSILKITHGIVILCLSQSISNSLKEIVVLRIVKI